jgi:hypothetical protein
MDSISSGIQKKVSDFTKQEKFNPDFVGRVNFAAGRLCFWVISIESYCRALKIVGPKRLRKEHAIA